MSGSVETFQTRFFSLKSFPFVELLTAANEKINTRGSTALDHDNKSKARVVLPLLGIFGAEVSPTATANRL